MNVIVVKAKARFMAELAAAAGALADNPEARRETLAMAETAVDDGLDSVC